MACATRKTKTTTGHTIRVITGKDRSQNKIKTTNNTTHTHTTKILHDTNILNQNKHTEPCIQTKRDAQHKHTT